MSFSLARTRPATLAAHRLHNKTLAPSANRFLPTRSSTLAPFVTWYAIPTHRASRQGFDAIVWLIVLLTSLSSPVMVTLSLRFLRRDDEDDD